MIGPYLTEGPNIVVSPRNDMLVKGFPAGLLGTFFADGGNLVLTNEEKNTLLVQTPEVARIIKRCIGAEEFIKGIERWCLWITDEDVEFAKTIPAVWDRVEAVRKMRLASKKEQTRKKASTPWKATEPRYFSESVILIPRVSSEKRRYIPMGYLPPGTVVTEAYCLYGASMWLFALLESSMHMAWARAVCGRLKTDYRYSPAMAYNTFPFPDLSEEDKQRLVQSARTILEARENHVGKTMAWLYNPETMPDDLKAAHDLNDRLVDSLFSRGGFENDDERLAELFKRYQKLTEEKKDA